MRAYGHANRGNANMKMECLKIRAHGHANRGNADIEMECLEIRAHGHANRGNADMEMKCLELRAHGHANRGNADTEMRCLEMRAHGHANRGNTDMETSFLGLQEPFLVAGNEVVVVELGGVEGMKVAGRPHPLAGRLGVKRVNHIFWPASLRMEVVSIMFYWEGNILRNREEGVSYDTEAQGLCNVHKGITLAELEATMVPKVDGAELAYYSKGQRILRGYKRGNGIVCSCCHTEISPLQFEAHAGWSARRQPYRNIYTSSGLMLHDIALSLANGQNLATRSSDDMCAACGAGGDLIICDGCPRAFHAGGAYDFSVENFDERTVMLCDQCEKENHVGCFRDSSLYDLKELPRDKWFCCDDCNRIHVALQNLVLVGAEMIPASVPYAIHRKHVENGFIDGVSNDVQWRILSGKSRYPEHLPVLSSAAAIF
ncbi:hypothetical protein HYC85_008905 [Camellia sinensis]|uniref:Zinc finger PHD-type domain-containing protein n=1 Tax=Camellia sinensis TaxID=4442 RepID=A0A7J7HTR5_CAMSI|nr:hypothetical protein HYC85_008905 [Camellia sinensis]